MVHILKKKKGWHKSIITQFARFGWRVGIFCLDNGGSYIAELLGAYMSENEIQHQTTISGTLQQSRKAECGIGVTVEESNPAGTSNQREDFEAEPGVNGLKTSALSK